MRRAIVLALLLLGCGQSALGDPAVMQVVPIVEPEPAPLPQPAPTCYQPDPSRLPAPARPPATRPALLVGDFSSGAWSQWQNLTFWPWSPKVSYQRDIAPDGQPIVQADSHNAGSMFVRLVSFDVDQFPVVTWRWSIAAPIAGSDVRDKDTDDAPARIYFAWNLHNRQDLLGNARSIVYIWGDGRPVGGFGASPYTDREGVFTLRSGAAGAGKWQVETRNLLADYRAFFHSDPDGPVTAVALLSESDRLHGSAIAWYGQIFAMSRS